MNNKKVINFFKFKVNKLLLIPFLLIYLIGYIAAALSSNIKVSYVYKVCPVFTVYVDDLSDSAGVNKGIVNFIRRTDKNSIVEDHEMVHAKQCYRSCCLSPIIAYFSQTCLAKYEAEAYAPMIKNKLSVTPFAKMIRQDYAPNVPLEKIELYLVKYM